MNLKNTLGIALALTLTTMASAEGFGSDCVVAPPQLSENAQKCYADECRTYLNNKEECAGDALCLALEGLRYHLAVGLCASLANTPETSSNLVVWLNEDGQWSIAWPGEEFEFKALRYEFNM